MNIDLLGRIKNTQLAFSKALYPLFEAIVNSIYSIEESGRSDGRVLIYITREEVLKLKADEDELKGNIVGFTIVDNGIGFTEENFKSFQTSDSTIKSKRGAKGIGRLLWLKAFEYVKVSSTYKEGSKHFKRSFEFRSTAEGIQNPILSDNPPSDSSTIVELHNVKKNYQDYIPKGADIIADRIGEHCLSYFFIKSCPDIILIDNGEPEININNVIKEGTKEDTSIETVKIGKHDFIFRSLKFYEGDDSKHKVHFCANDREVFHENLGTSIIDLGRKLMDEDERMFVFHLYVNSPYLDGIVNSERTGFNFKEEDDDVHNTELKKTEINAQISLFVKDKLQKYLLEIKLKKKEKLNEFVSSEAPQYRHLLKHVDVILEEIPYGITNERLDIELYKMSTKIEQQVKEKSTQLLNYDIDDPDDYEKYHNDFVQYLEDVNDIGKSKLSMYIIHRKLIIQLLSNRLKKKNDGNYKLEESIHEIIFPLRTTSNEIDYVQQNLWIIDEKLSFHKYLASDKQLRSMTPLKSKSQKRPDIVVMNGDLYDQHFLFVDSEAPHSSIIIIEFKRPMRSNLSKPEDDPIRQVYNYIREISSQAAETEDGRPIVINDSTRYFCYIIADLSTELRETCKDHPVTLSPDNMGYFGYNPSRKAYIEVISYDKLIIDANKRNSILFAQLGLPS
ncbi:MAG: ATP-binding protein [Sphingobacteriia bacterium]|nr:ATP-binding protein [Sphingobacteriia bacterium]